MSFVHTGIFMDDMVEYLGLTSKWHGGEDLFICGAMSS